MNSALLEDVQPWTNSEKQTKEPMSVNYLETSSISERFTVSCII